MQSEFIQLTGIRKSFAGVQALQGVDLTLERGKIHCLVGENGSGKSTLIKIIAGVYEHDTGTVVIDGTGYETLQPIDAIRAGIQVIYQDFSLFPNLTVAENIALNEELADSRRFVNWRQVKEIARDALAQIDVDIPLHLRVEDVSVANKQLIAISKALRQNAQLIIMDEPTTALTEREIRALFAVIHKLQQQGLAFLFVSHKLNEVLEISEQIVVIRNGRNVSVGQHNEYDNARLVYEMTGQRIGDDPYTFTATEEGPSLLEVRGVSAGQTLHNISFTLRRQEIVGVAGLLGSGRTDLALALFGMFPIDQGQISINGRVVELRSTQDAIENGIGYVPEDRLTEGLFLERSIGQNIIVRIIEQLLGRLGLIDGRQVERETNQWVSSLRIKTDDPTLPVKTLSGGNQQRVVLAKWLASQPQLLILIGPTVGVDIGSKSELHTMMKTLAQEGMGLLVISDDIPELLQTCNRILLMRQGEIVEEVQPHGITENELTAKLIESVAHG